MSANYEEIYLKVGWPDPKENAKYVQEIVEKNQMDKSTIHILDLACGTGLVGCYLNEMGFTHIDGVDASPEMLKQAIEKHVYANLDELFLGCPKTYPEKYHEKYEFTTASGVLADNHLDSSIFEEMLMSLKVGGHCIFNVRKEYLETLGYENAMDKLTRENRWKLVK